MFILFPANNISWLERKGSQRDPCALENSSTVSRLRLVSYRNHHEWSNLGTRCQKTCTGTSFWVFGGVLHWQVERSGFTQRRVQNIFLHVRVVSRFSAGFKLWAWRSPWLSTWFWIYIKTSRRRHGGTRGTGRKVLGKNLNLVSQFPRHLPPYCDLGDHNQGSTVVQRTFN